MSAFCGINTFVLLVLFVSGGSEHGKGRDGRKLLLGLVFLRWEMRFV